MKILDNFEDRDPQRDLPVERVIKVHNNSITIAPENPYGLWKVSFQRGAVPEKLRGRYTSYNLAEAAVDSYLKSKNKTPDSNSEFLAPAEA